MGRDRLKSIREAADVASRVFEKHWLRPYLERTHKYIGGCKHGPTKRMWIAQQAGDIETIMEELK